MNTIYLKYLTCFATLFSCVPAEAQSILSFAGGSSTVSDIQVSWSAGEVAISTGIASDFIVTQGFEQADLLEEVINIDTFTYNLVQINAITPDGDGINDYFIIDNIEVYPENQIVIINRWQEEVFKKIGYQNDWNGVTSNGTQLPTGVYYYIFYPNHNLKKAYPGTVHILR